MEFFDGKTFDFDKDSKRLTGHLWRVKTYMADARWHTLYELARYTGASEAGCSARLRDLRKERFGSHRIDRRRLDNGLWQYRLTPEGTP
jgi:hypothetical protein